MRILAFLPLPLLMVASVPAGAIEYGPTPAKTIATPHLVSAAAARAPRHVKSSSGRRHGTSQINSVTGPSGLIITDFKPDNRHGFANEDYLPRINSNLAYETDDYSHRMWRLKKVGPGSVVASVKYRF